MSVAPPPSLVRYVDAERRIADALAVEADGVIAAAFDRDPRYVGTETGSQRSRTRHD